VILEHGTEAVILRAIAAARPKEVCGLIVRTKTEERFVRLPNWSGMPAEAFTPTQVVEDRISYEQSRGRRPVAYVHSHAASLEPSAADLALRARSKIAMVIVTPGPDAGLRVRVL
jgi:proteasome lid subunit RPN8/RPN11